MKKTNGKNNIINDNDYIICPKQLILKSEYRPDGFISYIILYLIGLHLICHAWFEKSVVTKSKYNNKQPMVRSPNVVLSNREYNMIELRQALVGI